MGGGECNLPVVTNQGREGCCAVSDLLWMLTVKRGVKIRTAWTSLFSSHTHTHTPHTHRQTDRQTDRHRHTQTHTHAHTHAHIAHIGLRAHFLWYIKMQALYIVHGQRVKITRAFHSTPWEFVFCMQQSHHTEWDDIPSLLHRGFNHTNTNTYTHRQTHTQTHTYAHTH